MSLALNNSPEPYRAFDPKPPADMALCAVSAAGWTTANILILTGAMSLNFIPLFGQIGCIAVLILWGLGTLLCACLSNKDPKKNAPSIEAKPLLLPDPNPIQKRALEVLKIEEKSKEKTVEMSGFHKDYHPLLPLAHLDEFGKMHLLAAPSEGVSPHRDSLIDREYVLKNAKRLLREIQQAKRDLT